jgi:hypothetical protein
MATTHTRTGAYASTSRPAPGTWTRRSSEYKELASYKVAENGTYAYPIISGKRVFIKDKDAVTLWVIE